VHCCSLRLINNSVARILIKQPKQLNMKRLLLILTVLTAATVHAQIPTDGLLMAKGSLCTGFMYQHDQWKSYWEGGLKRENGNIGTVTTQTLMWYGVYGLNSKINLMASLPYISTKASMGTLHGMVGIQDLMLAVKYKALDVGSDAGRFRAFAVASFATPLSDYTPDFLPLAIGMASTTATARVNLNYSMDEKGPYINTSAGYTMRSNVTIDRSAYYTDGTYFSTNEVDMPNVVDYRIDLGYHKGALQVAASWVQMITLGGGDIRRQDMPFVSNQMNSSSVSGLVMYYLPRPKNFGVRAQVSQVVSGRNVGQSTSLMGGLLYTINFKTKSDETVK
jgi:hypothetical protein